MIPVRLKVSNFMCYRDNVPPLNFQGIHTACLSGENGNGKSALIDAMTWALWGKSRTGSDDELIHTGQPEMEVEFDFMVGNQTYRVIRKRSRPKKQGRPGQSILEFYELSNGEAKSLTDNPIFRTQQKISAELHMDYDTFVNSAFLRQGHADEFTIKRPAERKQVLANILGLSLYDRLEEQARELARQQEAEKEQLESALREIEDELAAKPTYESEFEAAQHALAEAEKLTAEANTRLNDLRQKKEVLDRKKTQLDQLENIMAERQRNLEFFDGQAVQLRSRIEKHEGLIARREAIEEGFNRLSEARKTNEEFGQKLMRLSRLKDRQAQLERVVFTAQEGLKTEHRVHETRINQLETEAQALPRLKSQWQQVQAEMDKISGREAELQTKRKAFREKQTRLNHLEAEISRLEKEASELDEKMKLLSAHAETRCPLCETELGAEGRRLIESKYTRERELKVSSLEASRTELAEGKTASGTLEEELSRMEDRLNRDKASLQSHAGGLKSELKQAEEAGEQLAREREKLGEIERRLARKDFAAAEQAALAEVESELGKIEYDPERHERIKQEISGLEQHEAPKRQLEEAEREIEQERESLKQAEANAAGLRDSLRKDAQKKEELAVEMASLPAMINDIAGLEAEWQELSRQQKQAQESVGSARARLQYCAEQEEKKKEKTRLLSGASREEGIYRELVKAFGKGGVQTMIIESALPEIEVEANQLLGRMTDNRMSLKFDTQRPSKKGKPIEVLDINISDELGTRNYEMFSGGEAFRINFAIRIALSRLLAHRSGAPLPTLIIDEGFGTQDAAGIEKLREAINSIQDDFEKLLVITHIEELRDAFPNRIEVTKTAAGSVLSVS